MNITAQIDSKPDEGMLQEKGGRGFPYCIFMDADGKVLKEARPSDEASFTVAMHPVSLLLSARKNGNKTKKSRYNLALMEAIFDPKEDAFEELKKVSTKKGVKEEIRTLFDGMIATWPVRKAYDAHQAKSINSREEYEKAQKELNSTMFELYEKGMKVADTSASFHDSFWMGVVSYALDNGKREAGLVAITVMEKKYASNAKKYFGETRSKLEAL